MLIIQDKQEKKIQQAYKDNSRAQEFKIRAKTDPRLEKILLGIQLYNRLIYILQQLRDKLTKETYKARAYSYLGINRTLERLL